MSYTAEYNSWAGMKKRCLNPRNSQYRHYGGRGIAVCPEWVASFEAFYRDMGPKPSPKHSLDRFPDNDGNYEPGNCRWTTQVGQASNKRTNRLITYGDETYTLTEWARRLGIPWKKLNYRIVVRGWTPERAFTTPVAPPRARS